MPFSDRREAGRFLAKPVSELQLDNPVVVAIPCGGVPVAFEIAKALGAPLDVLVVCSLDAPGKPEILVGAVAETAIHVLDEETLNMLGVRDEQLGQRVATATADLAHMTNLYRSGRPPISVQDRQVLLVTDALPTALKVNAAATALKKRGAASIVLASPVATTQATQVLGPEIERFVYARDPEEHMTMSLWYDNFTPLREDEVMDLLIAAAEFRPDPTDPAAARV